MNRLTCTEANRLLAQYQGGIFKTRILRSVVNREVFFPKDRVIAKRIQAVRLIGNQAMFRLQPLTVGLDQTDYGYRNVKHPCHEARDAVEAFLGQRVQHFKVLQRAKANGFAVVKRGYKHIISDIIDFGASYCAKAAAESVTGIK